jgi:hypothetical protein
MIIKTLNVVFPSLERGKYQDFIQDSLGSLISEKFNLELVYSDTLSYQGFGVESYYSWAVVGITDQAVAVKVYNTMVLWFKNESGYFQLEEEGDHFFQKLKTI